MQPNLRILALISSRLAVESVTRDEDTIFVTVRAEARVVMCPLCGSPSRRINSRYVRKVYDLPCSGRDVHLRVVTRRFCCEATHCRRRILAKRFDDAVLPVRSRRTPRLECIVHHLGLALGGRPAASFARRMIVPVSNNTLLRLVRRRALPRSEPLNVVGIDDWVFRRNHRYGTIIFDLEQCQIVMLLHDSEIATVQAWLADQPGITVLSRDRSGGYEAQIGRCKRVIGNGLRSHIEEARRAEVAIAGYVLNRMNDLGCPKSVRVS